jgi:hypothetical protein
MKNSISLNQIFYFEKMKLKLFCMVKNKKFMMLYRKHDINESYDNNEIYMFDFL